MADPLHIAFIDDDPAVRDSTRLVLRGEDIDATTYPDAAAFLDTFDAEHAPQCIVSDVRMPGMTGIELQTELQKRGIKTPLILVTGHGEISMAVVALKAGAADFIEKPFEAEVLAAAIKSAVAVAKEAERSRALRDEVIANADDLSARQREVMFLVADGYSNKQIAQQLGISARTVETYRLWVMQKMGATSLASLVRMVLMLPRAPREPPVGPDKP